MPLSSDLIAQFVKMTNNASAAKRRGATAFGTVRINGEYISVQLDGSTLATPALTTAEVEDGERVTVLLQAHRAIITGNIDSPAARNKDVNGLATDLVNAKEDLSNLAGNLDKAKQELTGFSSRLVSAEKLVAEKATIGQLTALSGNFDTLLAKKASFDDLEAVYSEFEELVADQATITNAKIEQLTADKASVTELQALRGYVDDLDAQVFRGTYKGSCRNKC